mmetsp:Transcript_3325/g.4857  ORF Transcript_3325/g.4857 Transcript_3325/m.4857 type:complete len:260 (+) Transcript_3325:2-781(+)
MEPFLTAAREAAGNLSVLRSIVWKVLAEPSVHSGFVALKEIEGVDKDQVLSASLNLFAFGTYQDYASASPGSFVDLNDAHILKLRQLTILSVVKEACLRKQSTVSYADLGTAIGLGQDVRLVEEVIISSVYAGILFCQLDQRHQQIVLSQTQSSLARDVRKEDILPMLSALQGFSSQLKTMIKTLDYSRTKAQEGSAEEQKYWKNVKEKIQSLQKAGRKADVDDLKWVPADSQSRNRQTKRSRGGFGGTAYGGEDCRRY